MPPCDPAAPPRADVAACLGPRRHYELWLNKQQSHDLIKMFLQRG